VLQTDPGILFSFSLSLSLSPSYLVGQKQTLFPGIKLFHERESLMVNVVDVLTPQSVGEWLDVLQQNDIR